MIFIDDYLYYLFPKAIDFFSEVAALVMCVRARVV